MDVLLRESRLTNETQHVIQRTTNNWNSKIEDEFVVLSTRDSVNLAAKVKK